MGSPFTEHRLSNGLRVVVERMAGVHSAAAGFLARTGSRDESRPLAGVSHFLEHMCFKGTRKRHWEQIIVDFDTMGSHYNAFTSKDRTFYYGWVRGAFLEQQIELLADMMRSVLPAEEFDMEKKVVLEEIAMSDDQIESIAYDFLHEQVYGDHALSWPVLGYEETVGGMSRDDMAAYLERRYAADNMVLVAAGNVDPQRIISMAERYCEDWQPSGAQHDRALPAPTTGRACRTVDRFNQQVIALAYPAPGANDPADETADAASAILGGDNSRIYWNIVQKGLSARAAAYRLDYSDSGLMLVFGVCEPDRCDELHDAFLAEMNRISREGVADYEVQRVKNKRRTSLAVEGESPYYRLVQIMNDVDYLGHPRTVEERLAAVDAVSVESIADYLRAFPIGAGGRLVGIGPAAWPA